MNFNFTMNIGYWTSASWRNIERLRKPFKKFKALDPALNLLWARLAFSQIFNSHLDRGTTFIVIGPNKTFYSCWGYIIQYIWKRNSLWTLISSFRIDTRAMNFSWYLSFLSSPRPKWNKGTELVILFCKHRSFHLNCHTLRIHPQT